MWRRTILGGKGKKKEEKRVCFTPTTNGSTHTKKKSPVGHGVQD